jgi:hypothetical protein
MMNTAGRSIARLFLVGYALHRADCQAETVAEVGGDGCGVDDGGDDKTIEANEADGLGQRIAELEAVRAKARTITRAGVRVSRCAPP